jgi:hypothetical protein
MHRQYKISVMQFNTKIFSLIKFSLQLLSSCVTLNRRRWAFPPNPKVTARCRWWLWWCDEHQAPYHHSSSQSGSGGDCLWHLPLLLHGCSRFLLLRRFSCSVMGFLWFPFSTDGGFVSPPLLCGCWSSVAHWCYHV